jgi:hypothetical protein
VDDLAKHLSVDCESTFMERPCSQNIALRPKLVCEGGEAGRRAGMFRTKRLFDNFQHTFCQRLRPRKIALDPAQKGEPA